MQNRHLISYILFVLAVVLFLALWLGTDQLLTGLLLGLVFAVGGVIFYRRGK